MKMRFVNITAVNHIIKNDREERINL